MEGFYDPNSGRFKWKPATSWYAFPRASSSASPNGRAINVIELGEPFSKNPLWMFSAG